ncbi:MAG: ferritin-like domain-containing protein [Saprospiraceae bacterium]
MNLLQIFSQIEEQDPEIYGRLDTRRNAMRSFASLGKKLALTSLPFALGTMLNKAYGQAPTSTVLEVLNFALTLEYLEYEFYVTGVNSAGLIPAGAALGAITTIRDHEGQHVNFLKTAITAAGGTPVAKPTFDLSGGNGTGTGPFKDAFTNYELFLAVAQTLEDTGVRAYKGQAGNLLKSGDVLEAALNIHSVEARHASHIRQMRKANGFGDVKPWITGKEPGLGAANSLVQANYNGEENTTQAGVNIININGQNVSANAASESFDEPLTKEQVLAIVDPFIV